MPKFPDWLDLLTAYLRQNSDGAACMVLPEPDRWFEELAAEFPEVRLGDAVMAKYACLPYWSPELAEKVDSVGGLALYWDGEKFVHSS